MPKQLFTKDDPPVRFDVRIPASLHYGLRQEAFRRKLSLNELILEKLLNNPSK